jgi:predicted DNA-binding transcriptional regulator AlpA
MEASTDSAETVTFTIKNFAIKLQISEAMVWKLIAHGQLKPIKIGRRTLIPVTEIQRLLNGGAA